MRTLISLTALACGLAFAASVASAQTPLRVAGNFSQNNKQVDIERAFFQDLGKASGISLAIN